VATRANEHYAVGQDGLGKGWRHHQTLLANYAVASIAAVCAAPLTQATPLQNEAMLVSVVKNKVKRLALLLLRTCFAGKPVKSEGHGGSLAIDVREDSDAALSLDTFGWGLEGGEIRRARRAPRPAAVCTVAVETDAFDFFTLGMTCYFSLLRYGDQACSTY